MSRNARQWYVYQWVLKTFGESLYETRERAIRLVEEAVELAQAEGVTLGMVRRVTDEVYMKAPGDPAQEAGGVGTTLLAYCQAKGISANECEKAEWERVREIDPEYFRERQEKKVLAGVASRPKV